MSFAKSVPGWKWNGKMKVWEYPMRKKRLPLVSIFPNPFRVAPDVKEHIKRIERNRVQMLELKELEDVS